MEAELQLQEVITSSFKQLMLLDELQAPGDELGATT
jgi:hypothetical protein